jgi:SAM-dependent methyltransferase
MLSLERQNSLRDHYRRTHPHWRPATEVYADLVRQLLQPDDQILDLGCGRGGLVEQLVHPLTQMVGIDPDYSSLQEHRLELPRATAFSQQLPFATGSFDLIFCSWLLEHLAYPGQTLQAIRRALRSGGKFVFITPNGRHPLALLNRGLGRFARLQGHIVRRFYGRPQADTFPTYYRANTLTALRNLAKKHGLAIMELHTIPDPTYLAFTPTLYRLMSWFEITIPSDRHLHLVGVLEKPI